MTDKFVETCNVLLEWDLTRGPDDPAGLTIRILDGSHEPVADVQISRVEFSEALSGEQYAAGWLTSHRVDCQPVVILHDRTTTEAAVAITGEGEPDPEEMDDICSGVGGEFLAVEGGKIIPLGGVSNATHVLI